MLVLTRRIYDSLMIGDIVEITVIEVSGNTVKLGISAPNDVAVHRSEVYFKIHSPRKQSLPIDEAVQ